MSAILLLSILIRFLAFMWSLVILQQMKDWRFTFLSVMIALMATRQTLTLFKTSNSLSINFSAHPEEIPGLIVSILVFFGMFFLKQVLTQQKQVEEKFRRSEVMLKEIGKNTPEFILVRDAKSGEILFINEGWERITGQEVSVGSNYKDLFKVVHPEDIERVRKAAKEYPSGGFNESVRIRHLLHGGERWVHIRAYPIKNEKGETYRVAAIGGDITERKHVEEALTQSAERLDLATRSAGIGIWDWDIKKDILVWDDRMFALYGVRKEDFGGAYDAWLAGVHPDDRGPAEEAVRTALSEEVPYDIQFRVRWPNGTIRHIKGDGQVLWDPEGTPLRMIGINYDITDRIKAEEALKETQRVHSTLMSNLRGMVYRCKNDRNWTVVFASEGCLDLTGYPPSDLLKNKVSFGQDIIHPDDQEPVWGEVQKALAKKERFELTYRIVTADDELKWVFEQGLGIFSSSGDLIGLEGFITDITDRKNAEVAVVQAAERLDLATHAARLGIWDWDIEKNELIWDDRMFELYGVKKEDFGGAYEAWVAGLHPDDRARCEEWTQGALHEGKPWDIEFRVRWPDGTIRFIKSDAQIIRDAEGKPLRMTGTNYDITERKEAEEALRQSEERFRGSFQTAAVGMGMVDLSGHFVEVNRALCDLTGYSEKELKKITFRDITHPDDRDENLERQKKLWDGERSGYVFEKRYIRKDGKIVWGQVSVGSIFNAEGVLTNTVGLIEDITERKRQAEQIEASLKEKEILLKEIHHRSKNNLQIISSLFNLQSDKEKNPLKRKVFMEGRARIQAMALVHEKLYKSKNLARINFSEYIDDLAGSVFRSYNMDSKRIRLTTETDEAVTLNIELAIPYGLIINELISNSLKYAFKKNKKGEVGVKMVRRNGSLGMTVWDTGSGLPAGVKLGKTETLGLTLVDTLVRQTGGTVNLDRSRGTVFKFNFPFEGD